MIDLTDHTDLTLVVKHRPLASLVTREPLLFLSAAALQIVDMSLHCVCVLPSPYQWCGVAVHNTAVILSHKIDHYLKMHRSAICFCAVVFARESNPLIVSIVK